MVSILLLPLTHSGDGWGYAADTLEFEGNFAEYIGSRYCVSVANGTDALTMALRATMGIKSGEVITTPNTYVATVEAIINAGYTPAFVDIDPETGLMDTDELRFAINNFTVAIIPVHLFGQCCNMDKILKIADGIPVIEDACQAHGAKLHIWLS